jgi:hypothetical protein
LWGWPQKVANLPAKNPTTEEFQSFMVRWSKMTQELQRKYPATYQGKGVVWSFDNVNIHTSSVDPLTELGIFREDEANRHFIPRYSPDFHQVIEHAFNYVKHMFNQEVFDEATAEHDLEYYWRKLVRITHTCITADFVQSNIAKLPELYDIVATSKAAGGTEGDWAPKCNR